MDGALFASGNTRTIRSWRANSFSVLWFAEDLTQRTTLADWQPCSSRNVWSGAGVPWQQAGEPAPMASNGSAMRAAPIGLFFAHDEVALRTAATEQSLITHQDPRCTAGSIAIAGATAIALQDRVVEPGSVAARLADLVREHDQIGRASWRE